MHGCTGWGHGNEVLQCRPRTPKHSPRPLIGGPKHCHPDCERALPYVRQIGRGSGFNGAVRERNPSRSRAAQLTRDPSFRWSTTMKTAPDRAPRSAASDGSTPRCKRVLMDSEWKCPCKVSQGRSTSASSACPDSALLLVAYGMPTLVRVVTVHAL